MIAARLAELRQLAETIEEPFRSAVLDRYFEDRPITEIADRQGISVPLANYRIRQGSFFPAASASCKWHVKRSKIRAQLPVSSADRATAAGRG